MATEKTKKGYLFAVGRRKEAVARVRLYSPAGSLSLFGAEYKKGDVLVNGKQIKEYFKFKAYEPVYKAFFEKMPEANKYLISIKVRGGGISGQLDAVLHGLARALDKVDTEKNHTILKENGYLTRDPRTRERRKVGNAGKARRKKSSPKR